VSFRAEDSDEESESFGLGLGEPPMRILDRERYWAYLKAYVVCFTALVGLYVVIDAFSNFDEFTKRASGPSEIFKVMGRYYLVKMTEFYDRLCGVIGMMAAIFTVTWMQKNNELLAMLAAGISTQRVIRPVIVSTVIVSALAVANQEFLMPDLAEELMKRHDDDGSAPVRVTSRYDLYGILVTGETADRKTQTAEKFTVTFPAQLLGAQYVLEAKQATYIPDGDVRSPRRGGWLLRGVTTDAATAKERPDGTWIERLENDKGFPPPFGERSELAGETYFVKTSLTFKDVTRRRQWYQYATTPDLIRGLSDPANDADKLDISVFLHSRLLRPLLGLSLLFLSLPQVLGGYGRNMFINLGLSLGTAALFYGVSFMMQFLAGHDVVPPELAAWGPLIGFGTFAVVRWDAIRT
jgi:lipopolysaccharide export system permease protein